MFSLNQDNNFSFEIIADSTEHVIKKGPIQHIEKDTSNIYKSI